MLLASGLGAAMISALSPAAGPVPPVYHVPVRPGCVFQPYAVPVH